MTDNFYLITPLATETILKSFKRTAFTRMVTHYFRSTYARIFLCQIPSFVQACRLPTRHVSKLTAWLTSFCSYARHGFSHYHCLHKAIHEQKSSSSFCIGVCEWKAERICVFCDGFINFQRACAFLLVLWTEWGRHTTSANCHSFSLLIPQLPITCSYCLIPRK